jgi:hypothetical protein
VGDLTQCERKRKCRYEDKDDRWSEDPSPQIRTELTKLINTVRYSKDCRNITWRQVVPVASEITVSNTMDKWQTTLRVEQIRREIADLLEENRIYKIRVTHHKEEIAKHEQRQRRLQEIMVELDVLSKRSCWR